MPENKPESSSRQTEFQDLLDQATEETVHHARVRAESAAAVPKVTKERTVAGALALAVPVLALLVTVNVFGVSLVDLITPTPSPSVARRLTQEALDDMVKEIEGFREDLPGIARKSGRSGPTLAGALDVFEKARWIVSGRSREIRTSRHLRFPEQEGD